MKILESYKKMAKSMLTEHAWDRKFGEPLPTLDDVMREAEVDDKKMIKYKDKDGEVKEMPASSAKTMEKEHPAKIAYDKMADTGGEEEPKSKGLGKGDFERDFDRDSGDGDDKGGEEPKAKPTGKTDTDIDYVDPDDIDDLPEPEDEEPSGEEGGEQNIPSDDEIDSYQEKLNTYTGPYSDGNEIHTKWEGITTKVWAETSEEAYKDDPDHPLNKPSDSEWADTVGEEVRALASAHFSDFGDELKDASPEAKAYFKEKGLPPSDEQGRTGNELNQETLMIDGKQYRIINESVKQKPKPKY